MKKFLKICSELRKQKRLSYQKVDSWLRYMQWESNPNIYYPISLIKIPEQQKPGAMITFY